MSIFRYLCSIKLLRPLRRLLKENVRLLFDKKLRVNFNKRGKRMWRSSRQWMKRKNLKRLGLIVFSTLRVKFKFNHLSKNIHSRINSVWPVSLFSFCSPPHPPRPHPLLWSNVPTPFSLSPFLPPFPLPFLFSPHEISVSKTQIILIFTQWIFD